MKLRNFQMDLVNIYFELKDSDQFDNIILKSYKMEVQIPYKKNLKNIYEIKLYDLAKATTTHGIYTIGIIDKKSFVPFLCEEFKNLRINSRVFNTKNPCKKIVISNNGRLRFSYLPLVEMKNYQQEEASLFIKEINLLEFEGKQDLNLSLTTKLFEKIDNVYAVDYKLEKSYILPFEINDNQDITLSIDHISTNGSYHIVVDILKDNQIISTVIKNTNALTPNQKTSLFQLTTFEERPIFSSIRKNISLSKKYINIKEILLLKQYHSFMIKIDLEGRFIKAVETRHNMLNKKIPLNFEMKNGWLTIGLDELLGFTKGDFWIYVQTDDGEFFRLFKDDHLVDKKRIINEFHLLKGTYDTARYIKFDNLGLLSYNILPAKSYPQVIKTKIRVDNLYLADDILFIELKDVIEVEKVTLGIFIDFDFKQNGKFLFINIPDGEVIQGNCDIRVLCDNILYDLVISDFTVINKPASKIMIIGDENDTLLIKSIKEDYFFTKRIKNRVNCEIPNFKISPFEIIIKEDVLIEKILLVNRKTLEFESIDFNQENSILKLKPLDIKPNIYEDILDFTYDIIFETTSGYVLPQLLKKEISDDLKRQNWQISPTNPEMLSRIYLTVPGNLAVRVMDNYYAHNWDQLKVDEFQILYETNDGKRIADSPWAIFKYMISQPAYKNYKHIWVIEDESIILNLNEKLREHCKFVIRNTRNYYDALITSKYLFNSHTFASFFAKKTDQIYINTWHGTALKKLGYDISESISDVRNVVRNLMMADYIISPNSHMTNVFADSFKLRGNYDGIILEGGYPRNDAVIDDSLIKEVNHTLQTQNVLFDSNLKTILFAPTYRGKLNNFDNYQLIELQNIVLELVKHFGRNYNIIVKVHPFIYKFAKNHQPIKPYLVPDCLDTNELLSTVDVLITDFSSILFDFLPTDKPIILFVSDIEQYKLDRGMYFEIKEIPIPQVKTISQLIKAVKNNVEYNINLRKGKYKKFKEKFTFYEDGFRTNYYVSRIIDNTPNDFLNEIKFSSNKTKLLFYLGDLGDSGITSAGLNLINNLDYSKYDVTIMNYLQEDLICLNNLEKVNKNARIMFSFGRNLYDSQTIVNDELAIQTGFNEFSWKLLRPSYQKNMQARLFPKMKFDYVIEFSGYGMISVKNFLSIDAKKHYIYLHSEMGRDSQKMMLDKFIRVDSFNTVFSLYQFADKLVNVSSSLMNENKKQLKKVTNKNQMIVAKNILNYNEILKLAKEEIDIKNIIFSINPSSPIIDFKSGLNFVTSGRLSIEKNQLELVRAFAKFVSLYPTARLFILGKGVMNDELLELINELNLVDSVFLLGHFDNPFAFINKMDYFLFPSLYEGQGLALLEALVLGKKVMASSTPAAIEMLGNYEEYGVIANGFNADALFEGMLKLIHRSNFLAFDYKLYNKEALKEFYQLINL